MKKTEQDPSVPSSEQAAEQSASGATTTSVQADAAVASDAPPPHPSVAIVEDWFSTHFHNMGAHLDERTYRLLHAAKEDLKARLAAQ